MLLSDQELMILNLRHRLDTSMCQVDDLQTRQNAVLEEIRQEREHVGVSFFP